MLTVEPDYVVFVRTYQKSTRQHAHACISLPKAPNQLVPTGSYQFFTDADTFSGRLLSFQSQSSNPKCLVYKYIHLASAS